MHAAGARRSRATGSSFGMNSRASQRADELAGADPANRAPLAHPRQLAGRSWPRVRRRGARFGDGLETDHLNGRPGGREATRCAVRPLRGAGEPSLLATQPRQRLHCAPDSGRSELPSSEMATLRAELAAHGNGVGQLGSLLSDTICHAISVFFNPAASDVAVEAVIKDVMDKLTRGAELLRTGAIPVTVLHP